MTTIYSPVISPFVIEVDENNYTVKKTTDRFDKDNNRIVSNEAYCSSFEGALLKIVNLKLKIAHNAQFVLLEDYIADYKRITKEVLTVKEIK